MRAITILKSLSRAFFASSACCAGAARNTPATALDTYVAAPDPAYSYRLIHSVSRPDHQAHVLEMTSQHWLTEAEVDRVRWTHWLTVVVPRQLSSSESLLLIGGGSNDKQAPADADERLVNAALTTGSVASQLDMVPNQPLTFAGENAARHEDALIAYTWDKYLRSGDTRWPAQLPMTKSAVRAMDTVTDFCRSKKGGGVTVSAFALAGASKRGWTAWTTAVVDERVIAVFPVVIDMLNVIPSFKHHWAAYGLYAPAIGDYERMGVTDWEDTPEYQALMQIVEPYEYRARLTMPKFIINATGDQFFLPDSSRFYFDDLPGIKYLRYVPNADHSLQGSDAWDTLLSCYHAVLHDVALPELRWETPAEGVLRVLATAGTPIEVRLWQATNPNARDFRLQTIGPAWTSTRLNARDAGVYEAEVRKPDKGWTAYMAELTYKPTGSPALMKFTTGVQVIPDSLPYLGTRKPADARR